MNCIGLPIDTKTKKISYEITEDLDGCFRFEDDNNIITDSTGFIQTFFDVKSKSLLDNNNCLFYNHPHIVLPETSIFNKNTFESRIYSYPKDIEEDIFEYFENWFAEVYSNVSSEYKNIALSVTMGMDSRYLMAILNSRQIKYKAISWGYEGKNIQELLPEIEHVDVYKNKLKYYSDFVKRYKNCNCKNWNFEFYVWIYYSYLIENSYDVIVEGLGRNFATTKPRMINSFDIQQIKSTFTIGRSPFIEKGLIKPIYPYAFRDIKYNLRKLNLSETEMVQKIHERVKYLDEKLASMYSTSFDKAAKYDDTIKAEISNMFLSYDKKSHHNQYKV